MRLCSLSNRTRFSTRGLALCFTILSVLLISGCASKRQSVALVYGEPVYRDELPVEDAGSSLFEIINDAVIEKYIQNNNLDFSDEEMIAHLKTHHEPLPDSLQSEFGLELFRHIFKTRLVARSLFKEYGGRVTISSFGHAIAIDAQKALLRDEMKDGAFRIYDPNLEKEFWQSVTFGSGDATLTESTAREMFKDPEYLWDEE